MQLIPRAAITIPASRQRTEIPKATLLELRDSIAKIGLLHPPAFVQTGEIFRLVAGERRLRAMYLLHDEKRPFICGGQPIPEDMIPVTLFSGEKDALFEAELEENIVRVDLPWPDRTKALAELHRRRQAENPKQTFQQTADELKVRIHGSAEAASAHGGPSVEPTNKDAIRIATIVAKHLDNPAVAKARNAKEAYKFVLQSEESKYTAELLRRRQISAASDLSINIRCGSCVEIMPEMDEGQFDFILTDPPYGVGADGDGYRERTVHHHNYDDSPENARTILQAILTEGFRLTKPKANLMIFTSIKHFQWLSEAASRMAWSPFPFPIIWQKSTAEGLVPWGRNGFIHTYDVIFFATKGCRGLNEPLLDILNYTRVSRSERVYAAEKPVPLLRTLIKHATLPGDKVFDPCAGSGSTLVAAKELKRHALGLEIDQAVVDLAMVRINEEAATSESPNADDGPNLLNDL